MTTRQTELADGLFLFTLKRNVFEQVHGPRMRKNYGARDPGPGRFALGWRMNSMLISVDFKSSLVADVGGKVTQIHSILCQKSHNHQLRINISRKLAESSTLGF
jgi:hypothetical protein